MTQQDHERKRPRPHLLRNADFVFLWCAYGISACGDHLSEMAILRSQNAASANVDVTPLDARMTFLFFVPFFLLAPLTGWLADRLPRRALMVGADLGRCVVMIMFMTLMSTTESLGTWGPFLPLLAVGVFAAVFSPARSAIMPTLIRRDQLIRANGLISGLGIIATMIALWIGGYVADLENWQIAFHLDAGTFALSAGFLLMIRRPKRDDHASPSGPRRGAIKEIVDGFRYVMCHRRVRELLIIAALVWFCGPLVKCVIPAVVRDVYGYAGNYQMMSGYRIYLGAGFIIGSIIVSTLGSTLRSEIAITWGLCGVGVGVGLFAASTFLPLATQSLYYIGAFGVCGAGMFAVAIIAGLNSLLQRIVPDRYRGRVFGVKDLVATAALLTATGAIGIPAWTNVDRWVGYILIGVAVIMIAAGVTTLMVRLRRANHGAALEFILNSNEFLAKFWWHLERVGRPTVPRQGAAILVANHTCSADPLFICAAMRYRPISFMVAAEYAVVPVAGAIMRLADCIAVKRDGRDTASTKKAIRLLREGKSIGIFVEGRIVKPDETVEPKDGAAMLALRTGAAVIPVHISGVVFRPTVWSGLFARHKARVRFGKPVDFSDLDGDDRRERTRAATRRIFAAIAALAPPEDDASTTGDSDGAVRPQEKENG